MTSRSRQAAYSIFRGRRGDTIKILWADADGLCLFTKRLEEGQFIWPAVRDGKISITRSQLAMLLDKLDWRQPKTSRLKEGANKRGNTSRLTQSFHFFMFEPIFSPVNALNQPI
ncbi:transposase [Escherichia coli]|nr:transposase [Escherichia coli]GDL80191.1 transposase [Escherichia coli]GDU15101.1 transposase [Escherichia coli]